MIKIGIPPVQSG